LCKSVVSRSQI